ncbi:MAG: branched-chain amino acid ABC transporter permease [Oscillospiraceae bacterium]|jgi:branched-chain amino acid transport system permease protein|nr:branched-chain amino acid ABC transporter permease [Oscillospiraceae bacterium]
MTLFLQQIINGIALGSVYALTAIGYSMVYGVLELVNFAHGNVYMAGAFVYYLLAVTLLLPWWLSFVLAVVIMGFFGVLYDAATLRPLRKAGLPKFTGLISSIGVSTVIYNVFFLLLGAETKLYPTFFEGRLLRIGSLSINYIYVVIVAVSTGFLLLLTFFINKTKVGMAMRAVAQSAEAAECMGISTNRIVSVTFFIGSALAAISGILSCMSYRSIDISVGTAITIKAFAATVLGGVGNLPGAVIGAFAIAIAEVLTAGYISSNIRSISSFIILILVLLFRPNGLMGRSVQKKV